jgi:hypothetical protein
MSQLKILQDPNQIPTTRQLAVGDIGINYYDGRGYFKRVRGQEQKIIPFSNILAYGQWQNNSTLSGSANVSQSFQYDTTDLTYGTSLVDNTKITVVEAGVYNLQFSAQLEEPGGGAATLYIWFRKNGINIPESATALDLANKGKQVAAWNFMTYCNAGDYLDIVWQSNNDATRIVATPPIPPNIPAIPSIITTITQIQ